MKNLKRFFSLWAMTSLLVVSIVPTALAAPGDVFNEVSEDVTVDQFLSAEYLLMSESGEYYRLGLVSLDVEEMNYVGGAFYHKGELGPVLNSWVYGTMVETTDGDEKAVVKLDGEWCWGGEAVTTTPTTTEEGTVVTVPAGNPMGEVNITFWMDGAVSAGKGYWNYYDDIEEAYGYDYEEELSTANEDFVIVESARSAYAKDEAAEIATEVQNCWALYEYQTGETTEDPGVTCELGVNPTELTTEEVFSGEYLLVDQGAFAGQRVSLVTLDDEQLQAYGLPATYDSAGVWYTRGEVPYPNRVLVGASTVTEGGSLKLEDYIGDVDLDNIKVNQTLTFDGVWFNLGDGDVLYDLVGEIGDEEADGTLDDAYYYGGDVHIDFRQIYFGAEDAQRPLYMVTCDGYITDGGYTYPFACGETGRSKHAQSEIVELEEMVVEYMSGVEEEEVEEALEETEDEVTVESEGETEVEAEETLTEEELETEQDDYVEETYEDVEADVWYAEYIDSEYWSGKACETGRGTCFDGSAPVLRSQAAKLVKAVLDKRGIVRDLDNCNASFKDVPAGEWYAKAVETMDCLGIMTGTGDGSNFEPGSQLTRAQAATVLARALGGSDTLLSYYNDVLADDCGAQDFVDLEGKESEWYYDTAGVMACMGIITGIEHEDGMYFEAETVVNRAQFAAMLDRAVKYNAYGYNEDMYEVATDGTYPYLVLVSNEPTTMDSCDFYPGPDVESVTVVSTDEEVFYLGDATNWMLMNDNKCNGKKGVQAMMGEPGYGPRGDNGYTSMGSGFAVFHVGTDLMNADGIVVTEVGDNEDEEENVYLYAAADPSDPSKWVYLGMNSVAEIETSIEEGGAEGSLEEQAEEEDPADMEEPVNESEGEATTEETVEEAMSFSVDLSGESMGNETDAMGEASFTLEGNDLSYDITVEGLFKDITGAHIHNYTDGGSVLATLTFTGDVTSGNWSSEGTWSDLTDAQIEQLSQAEWYVNVHTAEFPNGEISGFILQDETLLFESTLGAVSSEVTTTGSGEGSFVLNGTELEYVVTVEGLNKDLTSGHIHNADGDVILTLTFSGDAASGEWSASGTWNVTNTQILDLMEGEYYVNLHTADYPDGEVSGHINYVQE